ncbi:MAG: hypothetical protein JWP97_6032 [Labilithrix sp.]|nr:hypothetical protein [Labilithrix sp.]
MKARRLLALPSLAALVALATALTSACSGNIELASPPPDAADAGDASDASDAGPRCTGSGIQSVVADIEPGWGEPRAMAAAAGVVHIVFAGAGEQGIVTRVPVSGGLLDEHARTGIDPSAIAVSPDGAHVFVASRGTSQIYRLDAAGNAVVAAAVAPPSSVVSDGHAGAVWTVPSADRVFAWDFAAGGGPGAIATLPRATSLLLAPDALYIAGNHSLYTLRSSLELPRAVGSACNGGMPAVTDLGDLAYCADGDTIARVDLQATKSFVVATGQTGASDVIIARGRIFWRAAPDPFTDALMVLPLDLASGPVIAATSPHGALLLARDGCDLLFTAGPSLRRLAL